MNILDSVLLIPFVNSYDLSIYATVLMPLAGHLRNRFLLTVICCPIYHWLEISREVDISRARSASDIFTDD